MEPAESPEIFTYFNLFNEIGIISQLAGKQFEDRLPAGLTRSQFSVLNWLVRVDDEGSPGRLATAFQVTPGAMTNTLKKLSDKNLVAIEPDARSGRQKRVTITEQGLRMRERAIASTVPLLEEIAERIPESRLEQALSLLTELRQFLDSRRYQQTGDDSGRKDSAR